MVFIWIPNKYEWITDIVYITSQSYKIRIEIIISKIVVYSVLINVDYKY